LPDKASFAKRAIAAIYSRTAARVYEPVVVKRAFPLLGGDLNALALEQGRAAVTTADGGPILDMPVGTAYFTIQTARFHDGIVVGADIAPGMVVETERRSRAAGATNVVAVQADAHRLPFAESTFAAVLCTNGLQVIPGLEASVSELARVLAPGGILYVSVVTLPLSRLLPARAAAHVPTVLMSGAEVANAVGSAGLYVRDLRRSRFATLIEAIKPR